jgi:hypothetical protein
MNRPSSLRTRKCRNLLAPARVRRQAMAKDLDNLWRDIVRHATIEKDPQKIGQLTAELETQRQLVEAVRQKNVKAMDTNSASR